MMRYAYAAMMLRCDKLRKMLLLLMSRPGFIAALLAPCRLLRFRHIFQLLLPLRYAARCCLRHVTIDVDAAVISMMLTLMPPPPPAYATRHALLPLPLRR